MAEKKETKTENAREFIIPLREKCRVVPRYKKTNKAVRTIKEFLVRHMKIRDRDLNKIKLDVYLNEYLWARGIRYPPHKIKVKATKEGEIVRVELVDVPKNIELKKVRKEKLESKSMEIGKKKAESKPKEKKEDAEKKEEEQEKKSAVVEAEKEIEKSEAKKKKHESKKPQKSAIAQKKNLSR